MPIYFGHPNDKGLEVSPLLRTKGINLNRAAPRDIRVVARPLVKQPGYASYSTFLPAFMKAQNENVIVPLNKRGYTTNFAVKNCIPITHPALVVDYNGPIPSKHVDTLNNVGFERIKMQKRENIVHFPYIDLDDVRTIKGTSPSTITPAPANTVNLDSFDSWVLVLRLVSNLLRTHIYPAFRDNEHSQDEVYDVIDMITLKRQAEEELSNKKKRTKGDDGQVMEVDDAEEGEIEEMSDSGRDIELSKAKPIISSEKPWGTIDTLPNCSGLFFPFIAELTSADHTTVPDFIEQYLFQSLGDIPEKQLERMDKIRRAWGIISKTQQGDIMAHLCKVISLAIQSQARVYPIIQDTVYEGTILFGARLFVGINGKVYRPLAFSNLQTELGGYSTHARTLSEIAEICGKKKDGLREITTMRSLRDTLMGENLSEEKRDNIRKLAVHLHFKERFLGVNSGTLSQLIDSLASPEDGPDLTIPLHHSALFSNDPVFVALAAFGFQAPSFIIENCPNMELKGSAPQTLVIRQKPLDIACQDWKTVMETTEIRNNPRNLSRANRDRSLVGNDKTVVWGKMVKLRESRTGNNESFNVQTEGNHGDVQDNLDGDW